MTSVSGLVFVALTRPFWLVRWALIPLGLVRAAELFGWFCLQRFATDARGGAALCGAWALLRMAPGARRRAARERLLSRPRDKLRGAGIVALGLLAAEQDDRPAARALLRVIDSMDPKLCPDQATRVAREWLAADAAERGDWGEVRALSEGAPQGVSGTTRLLGLVADRRQRSAVLSTPA